MTTSKQLKQYDSNSVHMLLGSGQLRIAELMVICFSLVAKATGSSHRLIMRKWLVKLHFFHNQ